MPANKSALYIALQQGYFNGVTGLLAVVLLTLYFFAGWQISHIPLGELLMWGGPLFLIRQVITIWLQRFCVRPGRENGLNLTGGLLGLAAWPIYLMAFIGVVRQQPLVFKVTPKGSTRQRNATPMALFTPHIVLITICVACLRGGQPYRSPVSCSGLLRRGNGRHIGRVCRLGIR